MQWQKEFLLLRMTDSPEDTSNCRAFLLSRGGDRFLSLSRGRDWTISHFTTDHVPTVLVDSGGASSQCNNKCNEKDPSSAAERVSHCNKPNLLSSPILVHVPRFGHVQFMSFNFRGPARPPAKPQLKGTVSVASCVCVLKRDFLSLLSLSVLPQSLPHAVPLGGYA